MRIDPASHTDHVPLPVLEHVLERFADRRAAFVETVRLPDHLPDVACNLYGPAAGDPPVAEAAVAYVRRPGRLCASRVVDRPARPVRLVTVVAGPYGDDPCVLYTLYGGPAAPREPGDPTIKSEAERFESETFWADHALAATAVTEPAI